MAMAADPVATSGHKLITCFLPLGVATPLVKAIKAEKGLATAHVCNARGVGKLTQTEHRGLGDQAEKQVLRVVVPAEDADDVFEFIYFEAGINKPHGGLILMARVDNFVSLVLPDDIPDEDD
jgi:nitrogen regulatory protein PII